jgi:hypothetical protein
MNTCPTYSLIPEQSYIDSIDLFNGYKSHYVERDGRDYWCLHRIDDIAFCPNFEIIDETREERKKTRRKEKDRADDGNAQAAILSC